MYKFNSKIVKKLLNVSEDFRVPDALMELMFDRNKREEIFKKFLDIDRDVSYDWFHEYFQTEQAERKSKKQDFTPNSVAEIMNRLVGKSDEYFEPAAGTGGIAIKHWHEDLINNHNPFTYSPHLDFMVLEEQSERALPFLLFNLSIRGINAIVIHGDSLTREINNIYYVLNDRDDFLAFSTINVMPQSKMIASEFDVREWTANPINYIEADTKLWAVNVMKENKAIANFIKQYEQIYQGDK